MTLSILYKTHDEARLPWLRESLAAVAAQDVPTETVVAVPADAGPGVQLPDTVDLTVEVDDDRLTRARNIAARESTGEYVAFMDDDAYPGPGWARSILDGFEHADIVGGPLQPDWREAPVRWLPQGWHWLIGCGPYYDSEQVVPNTYGSNYAITREAFQSVGGFGETIGMGSDGVQQGGETELTRRARENGAKGVLYRPDAVVNHIIHGRSSVRALHARAFGQGRAKAALGVGDRESEFLRRELRQLDARDWRQILATISLTAAVGAGYTAGRLPAPLSRSTDEKRTPTS